MKLSLKILVLISSLFIFHSCNDDDTGLRDGGDQSPGLLGFNKGSDTFPNIEGENNILNIKVDISTKSSQNRIFQIQIDPETTTALPEMYTINEGSLIVPANENYGYIQLIGHVDQLPVSQVYNIGLKLIGIDGDFILNDEKEEQNISIFRACPRPSFPLDYIVEVYAFDTTGPTHEETLTVIDDLLNIYHIESTWGANFVGWATGNPGYNGQYIYGAQLTVNCDNTVTVSGDDSWATGGTGTYDPLTGNISATLNQDLFTNPFTVDIVMYPN